MTDRVDAGPILLQRFCHVRPEDDAAALWRRELAPMAVELFREYLATVERGGLEAVDQDESIATWEPAFERARLRDGGE